MGRKSLWRWVMPELLEVMRSHNDSRQLASVGQFGCSMLDVQGIESPIPSVGAGLATMNVASLHIVSNDQDGVWVHSFLASHRVWGLRRSSLSDLAIKPDP
jgi:hypothetical protein